MTFATIIDVIVHRAGDDDGEYRAQVRNWLNFVRSEIADAHSWRSAVAVNQTLITAAATTTGQYIIGSTNESIVGKFMYDETNNNVLQHESLANTQLVDPDRSRTGDPNWWADAGLASTGERQIQLWPIPDGAYTIRYTALKRVTDVTEDQESDTEDAYFGSIAPWSNCFEAGLDYYYDKDNNEDAAQIQSKYLVFQRAINMRRAAEGVATNAALTLENVRQNRSSVMTGRFDPAHYNNRGG